MRCRSARQRPMPYPFLPPLRLLQTISLSMTLPTFLEICSIKPLTHSPISPSRSLLLLVDQTCTHLWSDVIIANGNIEDGSVQTCSLVAQNLAQKTSLLSRQIPKAWG